jgi:hypothetical protein
MNYDVNDINTWPAFKPLIIAHDVGHRRDRSTAVVGGNSPYGRRLLGIGEAEELLQNLFGSERASALAAVDRRHGHNALIVADLSYDPTYAEVLLETFGQRVIGMQISRHFAKAEQSTNVRRERTMTSASRWRCWAGRRSIHIWKRRLES